MQGKELKLLVAGLGKLASDLFDLKSEAKTSLRLQVQDLERELIKFAGNDDDHLFDYTVTCVPDNDDGPDGNGLGKRISKILDSGGIPHLNDSESGQSFVYFNQRYIGIISNALKDADVGKFSFFPSHSPFFKGISNWPSATVYWNERTLYGK